MNTTCRRNMLTKLCLFFLTLGLSDISTTDSNNHKNVLTHLETDYVENFRKHFFEDIGNDDEELPQDAKMRAKDIGKEETSPKAKLKENITASKKGLTKVAGQDTIKRREGEEIRSGTGIGGIKRKKKKKFDFDNKISSISETLESSSRELKDWKLEWEDFWQKKKFEVLNTTRPKGEVLNMAGARPWGIPCGDPNQHDMPWGTCMLAMECEPEHRIYRGDFHCGRTEFVCCGFQLTTYDMDQAFDEISMESKGMSEDSAEADRNKAKEKERRKKSRDRQRKRRKVDQLKRKKKIRQKIKEIIKEMNKLLDKLFKNQTKTKSKKTKDLKRFLKRLKKQYKNDRISMQDIHNEESIRIDAGMMLKLGQLRDMNENFVKNQTFRDILVNGTVNKNQARMLVEAYPEMIRYIPHRLRSKDMLKKSRRSGVGGRQRMYNDYPYQDYLEYDIEYGYLYF